MSYAQLGEAAAACREGSEVLRLRPNFAWMDEAKAWNVPDAFAAQVAQGAEKAGILVWRTDKR